MDRKPPEAAARQEYRHEPEHTLARSLRTHLNLKPGQRGTKKLLAKYGDRLVCVRYRYDERRSKRLKTVELIVEESDWKPRAGSAPGQQSPSRPLKGDNYADTGGWGEVDLRHAVKAAGGRWIPEQRVWMLRYDRVADLGLEDRIVGHA